MYDETAAEVDRNFANDLTERPVGSFGTTGASPASWIVNAHHDIVGSTSSTGTVGRWYRYDPWGTLVASGGTGFTPMHRFQGSFGDLTAGLVWMATRWYDPSLGRFISEDSLLGEPRNPDSRHLYAYGEGDPINTWDPDGHRATDRTRTWTLAPMNAEGTFVMSIFIKAPRLRSCVLLVVCASGKGDGRGFTSQPDCRASRACITVSFGATTKVTVRANHSCGKIDSMPWDGYHCNSALPIWNRIPGILDSANGIDVKQTSSRLSIRWNLRNSIAPSAPGSAAIDGIMVFDIPVSRGRRGRIRVANDAFPSLQLFYRKAPRAWQSLMKESEVDPGELADGFDWMRVLPWPQ